MTRRFFVFLLALFTTHQLGLSLFRAIASLTRHPIAATTFGFFIFLITIMLGGMIVRKGDIKPWWIWCGRVTLPAVVACLAPVGQSGDGDLVGHGMPRPHLMRVLTAGQDGGRGVRRRDGHLSATGRAPRNQLGQ